MKASKKSGFTLIELMIVVAIIAIIAAIAIPNLLRSRMSANEAGAAGAMRTISTGEVAFQTAAFVDTDTDGVGDYGTLVSSGCIVVQIASCTRSGRALPSTISMRSPRWRRRSIAAK